MHLKNQTVILKNILYCDHYSVKYKVDNQEEINKKLEEGYDLKDIKISSAGEIAKREYESNGEKKVVIIEIYVLVKNKINNL
tara:strand:- start:4519 stop:4764 length:246 start_codon:yes stop_codon:yes gene_type:complete